MPMPPDAPSDNEGVKVGSEGKGQKKQGAKFRPSASTEVILHRMTNRTRISALCEAMQRVWRTGSPNDDIESEMAEEA